MSQRKIQRLNERWEKADAAAIDRAVSLLIDEPHGRKFLWWLLQVGRVGTQPFTANALTTSYQCGELNVGNQILARIIEVSPAGYVRMMQENANERSDRDAALANALGTDTSRYGDAGDGSAEGGAEAGGTEV